MPLGWEAITALATCVTAVVIALTVLVGVRQLRLTGIQLEDLRKATQLGGVMKIFDDLHSPTYIKARQFVANDLQARLQDPVFHEEAALGMIWTRNPDIIHEELFVLYTFESLGSYIRHGLLDRDAVLDMIAIRAIVAWHHLGPVIKLQRSTIQPRLWENFEHLNELSTRWFLEHGGREALEAWTARLRAHESVEP